MNIYAVALVGLLLTGCAQVELAHTAAEKISMSVLVGAEWTVCKGTPIGTINKRYVGRAGVYNDFCSPVVDIIK